ncbi:hypothetical protein BAE44_0010508 [Dichanthelium oligosanthes]|uniref:C2H2-type domain-containing protein n=1 Tax=Dichanthelium oligosanthes TaxID=888268 RepID=A0A1E5VTS1_9POAL|nr:hypothetical protein BAE44_0010508 [Dichanthelium oligosanthes]
MAASVQPAASPSPPPRPPLPLPPPPHHDTTLTLALALPPPPFACVLSPRPLHARRPWPDGASSSSSVLATVRSSPTGETPSCTECGKRFPSWKALFGHMRCHPECQWRGIMPPPHFRLHQVVGGCGSPLAVAAAAVEHQFTVQELKIATSLLMLAGARPDGGKGKKSVLASSTTKGSCGTPTSPPTAATPPRCADHKCSVCARGFTTGQALGGHKRCHWEKACAEGMAVAIGTPSRCSTLATSSQAAATMLDLNLSPSGTMPLPRKSDDDGSLNASLDLKLGY